MDQEFSLRIKPQAARPRDGERAVVTPYHNVLRDAEIGRERRARGCRAPRAMCNIARADFRQRRRKWLLALGFERVVSCGQVLREQLVELFRHAVQFRFNVSMHPNR